jgi:predicted dehydrogenase
MKKTRIAVVGAGYIGLAHVDAIQRSDTVTLCAVIDPSPSAAAREITTKAGVALYASLDQLLANDKPDGVVLATPNKLHVAHALQCMDAGLPTLLEKPIASTVAEAITIVEAVATKKATLLIGHHRAHSPIMTRARDVVQSGKLGRLVSVMGSALFLKPDHYFVDAPWRRELGAGPLLINMIHEIHNLRMLCGEIVAVQAIKSHAVRDFPVEDTAAIILQFANGALGTFMLSDTAASARSWEQTSQENKAYPSYLDEDCYVISGTFGSLSVPTMRMKRYVENEDRSWWKPFEESMIDVVRDDPIKLQMEHFGSVVRGELVPLVNAQDGLNNLLIVETIKQAASSGTTIKINSN